MMEALPTRRGEQNSYFQVAAFEGDDAMAKVQQWKEDINSEWNKDGNKWQLKKKTQSEKHDIENFQCNYARRKSYICPAVLRIRRIEGKQVIVVERARSHSDHKPIGGTARSFSSPVKRFVSKKCKKRRLRKFKMKYCRKALNIISAPLLKQIQNFVYRSKENSVSLSSIDLEKYYESNSAVPDIVDECFTAGLHMKKTDTDPEFSLVGTTPKLHKMQHQSSSVQVDSTYGLNWNGFPLMVAGFSDTNKKILHDSCCFGFE
uniref:Uncharacterized protein n=1 Tax=Ditylenchus dipsaci TaxID=166011 RepID=A0A915EEN9_9BILA